MNWYKNTAWHKWWVAHVWKPSWTMVTTSVYGIPAALVAAGEIASKFLNDTTIQSYLAYFSIPNWVPMGLAGIALIHYLAHGRD
jgi:hypothetical protein